MLRLYNLTVSRLDVGYSMANPSLDLSLCPSTTNLGTEMVSPFLFTNTDSKLATTPPPQFHDQHPLHSYKFPISICQGIKTLKNINTDLQKSKPWLPAAHPQYQHHPPHVQQTPFKNNPATLPSPQQTPQHGPSKTSRNLSKSRQSCTKHIKHGALIRSSGMNA